jgi:mRNA-degrading endonuclease RelE of RelBE toxin-antitoxin system
MTYEILVHEQAAEELEGLRAYDHRTVVEAIEEHLAHEPTRVTRHRKCLVALSPSFEHVAPVWQLRVGDFRVFYDVDEAGNTVHVRAVRRKDPSQRTEDLT